MEIERAEEGKPWELVATAEPDASGLLNYEDLEVAAGTRYGYRLRDAEAEGSAIEGSEVWLTIPVGNRLAIVDARVTHGGREVELSLELPAAGDTRIELLDAAGRRLRERTLAASTAGPRRAVLAAASVLPAGMYFVRVSQGEAAAVRKLLVAN